MNREVIEGRGTKTRVVNLRIKPFTVYIGRPGKDQHEGLFGNPFERNVKFGGHDAINLYRFYFVGRLELDAEFRRRAEALEGETLGCFCKNARRRDRGMARSSSERRGVVIDPKSPEEWLVSTDEEQWNGTESYASREEAIAHGPDEFPLEPGDHYWVGRKRCVLEAALKAKLIRADYVLEKLGEFAYDNVGGDFADDWPTSPGAEACAELDRDMANLIDAWVKKHGLAPSFYSIEKTSDHSEVEWPEKCENSDGCKAEPSVVFTPETTTAPLAFTGTTNDSNVVKPARGLGACDFTCSDCAGEFSSKRGVTKHLTLDAWKVSERLAEWRRSDEKPNG